MWDQIASLMYGLYRNGKRSRESEQNIFLIATHEQKGSEGKNIFVPYQHFYAINPLSLELLHLFILQQITFVRRTDFAKRSPLLKALKDNRETWIAFK